MGRRGSGNKNKRKWCRHHQESEDRENVSSLPSQRIKRLKEEPVVKTEAKEAMYNGDYVEGSRRRLGQDSDLLTVAKVNGFINYTPAPGDELMTCPYINSHVVRKAKMATHLNKCRAQHEKEMAKRGRQPEFSICRFNFLHHIPRLELEKHEMNCPDAAAVVEHLETIQVLQSAMSFKNEGVKVEDVKDKKKLPGVMSHLLAPSVNVNDDDDSWENESRDNLRRGIKAYDPQKKLRDGIGNIVQELPGISTKAERKAFNAAVYERFEQQGGEFRDGPPLEKPQPNGPGPHMKSPVDESDTRVKRLRDLMQAERNAELAREHFSSESRRRRDDLNRQMVEAALEKAESERMSRTSSSTFRSRDIDSMSVTSGGSSASTITTIESSKKSQGK